MSDDDNYLLAASPVRGRSSSEDGSSSEAGSSGEAEQNDLLPLSPARGRRPSEDGSSSEAEQNDLLPLSPARGRRPSEDGSSSEAEQNDLSGSSPAGGGSPSETEQKAAMQARLEQLGFPNYSGSYPSLSVAEKGRYPGYWGGTTLLLAAWWSFLVPILGVNAARKYPIVHGALHASMAGNLYYRAFVNSVTIDSIVMDLTILELEGVGITTLYFVTAVLLFVGHAIYSLINERAERKKIARLQDNGFDINNNAWRTLSRNNALKLLLANSVDVDDLGDDCRYIPSTASEKFIRSTVDYTTRIAKYCSAMSIVGAGVGICWMMREYHKLKPDLKTCHVFPIWAMFADSCSIDDELKILSLTSYVWGTISAFWFASYTAFMLVGPLLSKSDRFKNLDDKIDDYFEGADRQRSGSLYQDLVFNVLCILLPVFIGFAVYRAIQFSDEFAEESYCVSFWQVLKSLFTGNYHDARLCDSSRMAISLAGFLGNFELGKLWSFVLALKGFSYSTGTIISHIPFFKRDNVKVKAKKLKDSLEEMVSKAKGFLSFGVVAGGITAYPLAEGLGNHIIKNGFWVWQKLFGGIIEVQITPPCLNHTLNNMFWRSVIGEGKAGCDAVLVGRGFSGFVAPYWFCVTVGAALFFSIAFYPQLFWKMGLNKAWQGMKSCGSKIQSACSSTSEVADEDTASDGLLVAAEEGRATRSSWCCLWRRDAAYEPLIGAPESLRGEDRFRLPGAAGSLNSPPVRIYGAFDNRDPAFS